MAMVGNTVQAENSETFKAFSEVHNTIVDARSKLSSVYDIVATEWRDIERTELANLLDLEEKLNRAKSDFVYLKSQGTSTELQNADDNYVFLTTQFVSEVGAFEIKMEALYEEWIQKIAIEEKKFYQKAFELYTQREIKIKESQQVPECAQQ